MRLMALSLALAGVWGSYTYSYAEASQRDSHAWECDLGNGQLGLRCGDSACVPGKQEVRWPP